MPAETNGPGQHIFQQRGYPGCRATTIELAGQESAGPQPAVVLFQPGLGGGRLEPDGKTPGAVARSPPLARNGFEAVMETGQVLVGLAAFAQQRRGEQPAEPGHVL